MEGAAKGYCTHFLSIFFKGWSLLFPCVGNRLSHSCHSTVPLLAEDPPPSQDQDGSDFLTGCGLRAGTVLHAVNLRVGSLAAAPGLSFSTSCSVLRLHQRCIHSSSHPFSLLGRWAWASAPCSCTSQRLWLPRTSRARWLCSAWHSGS